MEWLREHETLAWWLLALSVAGWILGFVGAPLLLIRMPADYFSARRQPRQTWLTRHPISRAVVLVVKNLLGAILFLAGVVMLFTPGQGLLAIAIGVCLMDIPGKRKLERRIISRPRVLRAINALRAKAGRPPLEGVGSLIQVQEPAPSPGSPPEKDSRPP